MRLSAALLWFLVVAATTLVAAVLLASTADASCATADRSRDAHLIGEAEREYATILKSEPDSACAVSGMIHVTSEKCSRADKLRADGATADARKVYVQIVTADLPGWNTGKAPERWIQCAISGLASLADKEKAATKGDKGDKGDTGGKGEPGPPGKVVVVHGCKWKGCHGR